MQSDLPRSSWAWDPALIGQASHLERLGCSRSGEIELLNIIIIVLYLPLAV